MKSLYPGFGGGLNSQQNLHDKSILFPARVKDIILSNESPSFKSQNGWAGLGVIEFKPLYGSIDNNTSSEFYAKPLFSNIKQYPLKEELVLILNGPSPDLNENPNSSDYYYLNLPINFWNNNHHNAFPDINYTNEVELGNTFTENPKVNNLLPEEGDLIFESRFGSSIRFSSTTSKKNNLQNSWSSHGNDGDPILIIRNKQTPTDSNPWIPVQEDINNDGTSIYLCSGQEIPINLGCKNLKSFAVTISDSFNNTLQIPDNVF